MTEIKKYQLDEVGVTDILSYLGTRTSSMEEKIRRGDKQLTKAKDIVERLLKNQPDTYSGTDIKLNQTKMFKFSQAGSDAVKFLKECEEYVT